MCEKNTALSIVFHSDGSRELVEETQYLFCDDLWRYIKEFIIIDDSCFKFQKLKYYKLNNLSCIVKQAHPKLKKEIKKNWKIIIDNKNNKHQNNLEKAFNATESDPQFTQAIKDLKKKAKINAILYVKECLSYDVVKLYAKNVFGRKKDQSDIYSYLTSDECDKDFKIHDDANVIFENVGIKIYGKKIWNNL